ncbi:hypothetical protein LCGC14_1165330 [marine sediment metagenome]|uniref:Uncharacterized protein n=1 Tax=marine sediment metagenome TaxID=412755 RepID=A0A0F9P9M0_9ZZZZ
MLTAKKAKELAISAGNDLMLKDILTQIQHTACRGGRETLVSGMWWGGGPNMKDLIVELHKLGYEATSCTDCGRLNNELGMQIKW